MATAQKRIAKVKSTCHKLQIGLAHCDIKEYSDLQKKPLDGMKISLPSEADMHQWQILLDGPKGSPYEVS